MSHNIIFYSTYRHITAMYIAFRWLLGLTITMWIAICCLDAFVKKNTGMAGAGDYSKLVALSVTKNITDPLKTKINLQSEKYKQISMGYLHYIMFIAGALAVSLYSRINTIIFVAKQKFDVVFTKDNAERFQIFFKITAAEISRVAIILYKIVWVKIKNVANDANNAFNALKLKLLQKQRINNILLRKLREIGEERRNLAELLLAAIHENKNIRMQFELESMAKKRLMKHIEDTQKIIKDNRSRFVGFQQLYLVTHQENVFLKFRLEKLVKEKDEADKNLMELMNEVYRSKNNELKAFCSRYIVKSKTNLLNFDVGSEIQTFLQKSHTPKTISNCQTTQGSVIVANNNNNHVKDSNRAKVSEVIPCNRIDALVPLKSESPKLKGLPGECVWTVKDKDGLIEKLYEYDYESDSDTGETIRRIREYSVYYDKDCLLDFSRSSTRINGNGTDRSGIRSSYTNLCPLTNQRFLTGSEAFRRFMENNKSVVSTTIFPSTPMLSFV